MLLFATNFSQTHVVYRDTTKQGVYFSNQLIDSYRLKNQDDLGIVNSAQHDLLLNPEKQNPIKDFKIESYNFSKLLGENDATSLLKVETLKIDFPKIEPKLDLLKIKTENLVSQTQSQPTVTQPFDTTNSAHFCPTFLTPFTRPLPPTSWLSPWNASVQTFAPVQSYCPTQYYYAAPYTMFVVHQPAILHYR